MFPVSLTSEQVLTLAALTDLCFRDQCHIEALAWL